MKHRFAIHFDEVHGAREPLETVTSIVRSGFTPIAAAWPALPIQIGGGIRNLETIEHYVRAGVSYVIIGTRAVKDPAFVAEACAAFPGRIKFPRHAICFSIIDARHTM